MLTLQIIAEFMSRHMYVCHTGTETGVGGGASVVKPGARRRHLLVNEVAGADEAGKRLELADHLDETATGRDLLQVGAG